MKFMGPMGVVCVVSLLACEDVELGGDAPDDVMSDSSSSGFTPEPPLVSDASSSGDPPPDGMVGGTVVFTGVPPVGGASILSGVAWDPQTSDLWAVGSVDSAGLVRRYSVDGTLLLDLRLPDFVAHDVAITSDQQAVIVGCTGYRRIARSGAQVWTQGGDAGCGFKVVLEDEKLHAGFVLTSHGGSGVSRISLKTGLLETHVSVDGASALAVRRGGPFVVGQRGTGAFIQHHSPDLTLVWQHQLQGETITDIVITPDLMAAVTTGWHQAEGSPATGWIRHHSVHTGRVISFQEMPEGLVGPRLGVSPAALFLAANNSDEHWLSRRGRKGWETTSAGTVNSVAVGPLGHVATAGFLSPSGGTVAYVRVYR